jgi:2,5-diamino-6-(ribosylamino)-4(3H)-pyrimidinone 5'-phosphate reductase
MALASLQFPWVIIHQILSVDGNLTGFEPDARLFFGVAAKLEEHATLSSALALCKTGVEIEPETEEDKAAVPTELDDARPICIVTDTQGRVRNWHTLKKSGIWKDFIALVSADTPEEYLGYLTERRIKYIRTGEHKCDLEAALRILRKEHDVRRIRVDGCGALNGALMSQGLVDELSVLVHPCITGSGSPLCGLAAGPDGAPVALKLISALEAGEAGYVWLRYMVEKV